MYNAMTPKKCPKCGEVVKVNTDIVLTSYPPQYHWVCPKCGKTGYTDCDAVALENKVFIEATTPPPKTRSCDIPAPNFIQQGWECPKCGAVLAPNQSYCPFCSPSEYGRSNWVVTTPVRVPLEQYTNPNPSTAISLGDKPKKSDSCSSTLTFGTPCDIRTWKLEQ